MQQNLPGLNPFERRLVSTIDRLRIRDTRLLLAVSGGRDSMVMLRSFCQLASRRGLSLCVGHIHHGGDDLYRASVQSFVERASVNWKYITNHDVPESLVSEQEMRQYRYRQLELFRQQLSCEYIVLAHHFEDLVETRLMRLIRGTGPGGLEAMKPLDGVLLRPFLETECVEFREYVDARTIEFMRDPSNATNDYFRNWMRNDWLSGLEAKSPGAIRRVGYSLQSISDSITLVDHHFEDNQINRTKFESLCSAEKLNMLAAYMQHNHIRNYTRNQLLEVIKRLSTPRKSFEFRLAKNLWCVNKSSFGLSRSS